MSKEKSSGSRKSVKKVPTKNSINLIARKKSSVRPGTVILSLILIPLAAVLISRFAVLDLLEELDAAQSRVKTVQSEVDDIYDEIDSYKGLEEKYPHYTFSGMNDTELTTVSRADILSLLRQQVIPYATVDSWSVYYNTVSLKITAGTLQEINLIAQRVNEDDRVDYCTVNSAKDDIKTISYVDAYGSSIRYEEEEENTVTAQLTITMKDVLKGVFKE